MKIVMMICLLPISLNFACNTVTLDCVCEGADAAETYTMSLTDSTTDEQTEEEWNCNAQHIFKDGLGEGGTEEMEADLETNCCTGEDCACTCTEVE
jgi:hypothetical protein